MFDLADYSKFEQIMKIYSEPMLFTRDQIANLIAEIDIPINDTKYEVIDNNEIPFQRIKWKTIPITKMLL